MERNLYNITLEGMVNEAPGRRPAFLGNEIVKE